MEGHNIRAVPWVDLERIYSITRAATTLLGQKIYRERYRRRGNTSKKAITETYIPQIAETYYSTASQVNLLNLYRQYDLNLEKNSKQRIVPASE